MNKADPNLNNRVLVGYYDPFNVFQLVEKEFRKRLPLTNLHWRYDTSHPLKTISSLGIKLVEEIPNQKRKQKSPSVYTRLMFVKVDSIDVYRSQIRPLISEWIKCFCDSSSIEWAVFCIIPSNSKNESSTLIKRSFFDKLKVDFGINGKELEALGVVSGMKERCFKLKERYDSEQEKMTSFNETVLCLKDLLLSTFSNKFERIEANINRKPQADSNFSQDELELARLFRDMGLLQDSLEIFDKVSKYLDDKFLALPSSFEQELENSLAMKNPKDVIESDKTSHANLTFSLEGKTNYFDAKTHIFLMEAHVLQMLANNGQSDSLSARYIAKLFQKLGQFANELYRIYGEAVGEWLYVIIQTFLEMPICEKFINLVATYEDGASSFPKLDEFIEFRADLLMTQRNMLKSIGKGNDFFVGSLIEPLEEVKLDDGNDSSKQKVTRCKELERIFGNEEEFFVAYQKITETVIEFLSKARRSKTVDALSIDLALLNHYLGNYKKCLDILQDSFTFYIKEGWIFMGTALEEIYLDCIEKVNFDGEEEIVMAYLDFFSNLALCKDNIKLTNNYRIIRTDSEMKGLVDKAVGHSEGLETPIEYPLSKIFSIDVMPFIFSSSDDYDRYVININVRNNFGVILLFEEVTVTLENFGEMVTFSSSKVCLEANSYQKIPLFSNDLHYGLLKLNCIKFKLCKNITLTKFFSEQSQNDATVIHNESELEKTKETETFNGTEQVAIRQEFFFYPDFTKFWCKFEFPKEIELNKNEIKLQLHNGRKEIRNIRATLTSTSKEVHIDDNVRVLDSLMPSEESHFIFSHSLYSSKLLEFQVKIEYNCEGEIFHFVLNKTLDVSLSISVSVQDIFKTNFIYSKFQIGRASSSYPIRIESVSLTGEDGKYSIIKPRNSASSLVLLNDQSASYFYKVIPKEVDENCSDDALDLRVYYSNLREECSYAIKKQLKALLEAENLVTYWFFIEAVLLESMKFDVHKFAGSLIISVSNVADLKDLFDTSIAPMLPRGDQKKIKRILLEVLSLDHEDKFTNKCVRQLYISVPIPILHVLQTVRFEFERKSHFIVGEPISTQLSILTTQKWSQKGQNDAEIPLALSSPKKGTNVSPEEFQLSIQNDDNWLISGFRTYCFNSETSLNGPILLNMSLVPLCVGKLPLPRLSIRRLFERSDDFSMDVELLNGIETLLIVPEVESVSFTF